MPTSRDDGRATSRATGRVEVIGGPMFAGKTEELLRRVRRATIAARRVVVISHALDVRSGADRIVSHAGLDAPSVSVGSAAEIAKAVPRDADLVAIDEAQFFGPSLVRAVADLADRGLVVVVAGLDVTFAGQPFEPLPSLMALAERVDKLTAICSICGADAIFHERMAPAGESADTEPAGDSADTEPAPEHVGGAEKYQARCRAHFRPR